MKKLLIGLLILIAAEITAGGIILTSGPVSPQIIPQNQAMLEPSTGLKWFYNGNNVYWRPLQFQDTTSILATQYYVLNASSLPSQIGQAGKFLTTNGTNASWGSVNSAVWGNITGTLSSQTDLQSALNAKQATLTGPGYVKQVSGSPTYITSIPNADLANSAITINSVSTSLGGSFTVTKSNTDTTSTGFATNSKLSTYLTKAQIVAGYQPLLGFTAVPTTRTITINGVTLDLSANRSWTVGSTVTPVSGETPSGTINGSNPTFTIAHTPVSGSVSVFFNGLMAIPTTDWTISGTTITMTSAPVSGDNLLINYQY